MEALLLAYEAQGEPEHPEGPLVIDETKTSEQLVKHSAKFQILQEQLKVWDGIVAKKEAENPMFKKVNASMKAFAERAGKWSGDTNVDYRNMVLTPVVK